MTDEVQEQEQEDQAPQEASAGYVLSMSPRENTLHFPEFGDQYFIAAKAPRENEDAITNAGLSFTSEAAVTTEEGVRLIGNVSLAKQFVEKCMQQITDFCLPAEKEGVIAEATFDRAKNKNRHLYVCLLDSPFRQRIEAFLDDLAGRGVQAQRDYDALGEEQARPPSTS